jgi:CDP-glucose 4,6-dehydratase
VLASARAGNVIGGGDWAVDRLVPDLMRAAMERRVVVLRNPDAIRPWQHVLNPLGGYLLLAEAAWDEPAHATGWNFGPEDRDAQPVRWIVDRIGDLWDGGLRWELDAGPQPHEAHYLKLDSSRARMRLGWRPAWDVGEGLRRTVEWYRAFAAGDDVRELTLEQIRVYADESAAAPSPR